MAKTTKTKADSQTSQAPRPASIHRDPSMNELVGRDHAGTDRDDLFWEGDPMSEDELDRGEKLKEENDLRRHNDAIQQHDLIEDDMVRADEVTVLDEPTQDPVGMSGLEGIGETDEEAP